MEDYKQLRNYMVFRKPRTRTIRELNNIYVVAGVARNAVEDARSTLQSGPRTKLRFEIPTVRGETVVAARNRSKILYLLERASNQDLFAQALVPAVAVTEGYMADMLRMVLRAFPKKLSGKDKKVELSVILDADDIGAVLEEVITTEINAAFYASPAKYFSYIEGTLSISIQEDRKLTYSEIKATRDIYVHNGGIANGLYRQKAGRLARAEPGASLPLDETYFDSAISCMKGVVQAIYKDLLKKYGDSKEFGA
jgi:hypothetical protein